MIKSNNKYDEIIKKLQQKDFRLTDVRKAIIKLFTLEKDISINDIIAKLKKTNGIDDVNVMSVYNTIGLLMDEHIIHANVFKDKQIYYELSDNVIHVICNICHKVFHFNTNETAKNAFLNSEKLASFLDTKKKFRFSHFALEIHGICSNCQKHMKNS
ncbi:MAG: Fur family transcriptional regulator [Spiroplasma sp.]